MDSFKLEEKFISFQKAPASWEEAIRLSADSLLRERYFKDSYIDGMIESVKEHGPYIIIAPNIAMPHARPEAGAIKGGYAITLFDDAISFDEKGEYLGKLFICLSCVEANAHIKMMQEIVTILSDSNKHDNIFAAKTKQEILDNFK